MYLSELDKKDHQILYLLDIDSRQPVSRIAKKIGMSQEVVNYRLKRLEKNAITHYQVIVDFAKLGIIQFKLCLGLSHMKAVGLERIIASLKKIREVKWIASCSGSCDIIISFETDTLDEVNNLKNRTLSLFDGKVHKKAVAILVQANTFSRDYLDTTKKQAYISRNIQSAAKLAEIDDTDLKILRSLAHNARKPILTIAKETCLTARVAHYRIKSLIQRKIITGFKIALDYENLGIQFYKTFFYLDNPAEMRLQELMSYLAMHRNIIHDGIVLGNWDLEPEFEVENGEEFTAILEDIKDRFSDIIRNIEVVTITKEHMFEYF